MKYKYLLISTILFSFLACKNKAIIPLNDPYFSIPDKNFEQYLVENKIDKDGLVNGKMAKEDTKGITELKCIEKNINSLLGIENFGELEILFCGENKIKNLDLSKNLNLEVLWCNSNQIETLDVSKNLNLRSLNCSNNMLFKINVINNLKLNGLDCSVNQILNLDISKILILYELNCTKNNINTICVKDFDWIKSSGWQKDPTAEYKICN